MRITYKNVIKDVDAVAENIYVQGLTMNGKFWPMTWLRHAQIETGLILRIGTMAVRLTRF